MGTKKMDRGGGVSGGGEKNQEVQQGQDYENDQAVYEPGKIDWSKPVKFADECSECPDCGEPWCDDCDDHYADCACPGPHSEDE